MSHDEWDALVRKLDARAKSDPGGYKRAVALWAAGGYAVLLGALALTVGAVLGIVLAVALGGMTPILLKLTIPVAALAFMLVRSLFVRLPAPDGIELSESDAPGLFAEIERLREKLGAPQVSHVLLTGDFNASIVQLPRFGPLGWQRNYLVVGVPFMEALSPEEFSSVIAHELGHIGGGHGRFSAWIYRLRSTWSRVMTELDNGHHLGTRPLRSFFHWYVPRFSAASFALARAHEYEADNAAAAAAGARHAALALTRAAAAAPTDGRYWEDMQRRVATDPAPPRRAFTELAELLRAGPGENGQTALRRALSLPTDTSDTHPALADRLTALGCVPDTVIDDALERPDVSAAQTFDPGALERLTQRLDREWHEGVQTAWTHQHSSAAQAAKELERLDAAARTQALDAQAARERAGLTHALRGKEASLPLWHEVLALDPGDSEANLEVGSHLLSRDDDRGLDHLARAAESDPASAAYAAEMAHAYEAARGRTEEANRHRAARNSQLDNLEAAQAEREALKKTDELEPHGLPAEALGDLEAALRRYERVGAAFLARKRVQHMADEAPVYVLGVTPVRKWWRYESPDYDHELVEQIAQEVVLPGEYFAVPLSRENKWLRKRLEGLGGALG